MLPNQPQEDPKIGVSCKRGANFAESAMPSQIHSPRGPKVALRRLETAQDEPRWSQDGPRWPEDGPKMEPRWGQDGAKTATKRPPGPFNQTPRQNNLSDLPKSSKFAVLQSPSVSTRPFPPSNSPNASRQSRNQKPLHKCNLVSRYIYIHIYIYIYIYTYVCMSVFLCSGK